MKYNWNKERIEAVIKDCDSLSQVLDKLNIPKAGSVSDNTIRKWCKQLNLPGTKQDWKNYK